MKRGKHIQDFGYVIWSRKIKLRSELKKKIKKNKKNKKRNPRSSIAENTKFASENKALRRVFAKIPRNPTFFTS